MPRWNRHITRNKKNPPWVLYIFQRSLSADGFGISDPFLALVRFHRRSSVQSLNRVALCRSAAAPPPALHAARFLIQAPLLAAATANIGDCCCCCFCRCCRCCSYFVVVAVVAPCPESRLTTKLAHKAPSVFASFSTPTTSVTLATQCICAKCIACYQRARLPHLTRRLFPGPACCRHHLLLCHPQRAAAPPGSRLFSLAGRHSVVLLPISCSAPCLTKENLPKPSAACWLPPPYSTSTAPRTSATCSRACSPMPTPAGAGCAGMMCSSRLALTSTG